MKICNHDYSNWSEAIDENNRWDLKHQAKKCVTCGKIVVRRIWWTNWIMAETINNALKKEK